MSRFAVLELLLISLFVRQNDCLYSIYRLDEESPSFAIHGVNLDRLGSITIFGLNGSDFLVDFAHADCENVPDYAIESNSEKSFVFCLDPFPLSINGGIPEKDKCKEVMPFDMNFTRLLYMCSFKIPSTYQVTVEALDEAVSLEYAISFRVSKWVNVSRRIIVLPTSIEAVDTIAMTDNALVRGDTIATIVLSPTVYNPKPIQSSYLKLSGLIFASEDPCTFYQDDMTCPGPSTYSTYLGADPGLAMSQKHHVDDEFYDHGRNFQLRSSVVSVFSQSNCAFCVSYGLGNDNGVQQLNVIPEVISSNNYLWEFDDPRDFPVCQSIYTAPSILFTHSFTITIDFISFTGITMNITSWTEVENIWQDICNGPSIDYEKSFAALPDRLLISDTACMQISWCPVEPIGEAFGFAAITAAVEKNLTRDDCYASYELFEHEPQAIFHPYNIFLRTFSVRKLYCVFQTCQAGEDCRLLVDIAINCPSDKWYVCRDLTSWKLYEINGQPINITNCTFRESPMDQYMLLQCTMIFDDHVYFRNYEDRGFFYMMTSISVRSFKWMSVDDHPFYLMPNPANVEGLVLAYRFGPLDTPAWITLSLNWPAGHVLENFAWGHNTADCEYHVITGPPDQHSLYPERYLMTFRDESRFTKQYLDSQLYSILVPPGCNPSIAVFRIPDDSPEDTRRHEELCDGIALVTTRDYLNPFAISSLFPDTYLNRTITCSTFKVDILVEILDIGEGNFSVNAFDEELVESSTCLANQSTPFNCSFSGVSTVKLDFVPMKSASKGDRCFMRVHVGKTRLPFTSPTYTPIETTTTIHSLSSIRSSVALFVIVLAYAHHR